MTDDEWANAIQAATAARPAPIVAHTYRKKMQSASSPRLVACHDGAEYWIKWPAQIQVGTVTEQVVARLGSTIGAFVGEVALIEVPPELPVAEPELADVPPGVVHGCRHLGDVTDRLWIDHLHEGDNRERFARLALLYGWMIASDHQVLYETQPPYRAWSVDHAFFFPPQNSSTWTIESLEAAGDGEVDERIVRDCQFTDAELEAAAVDLSKATDQVIATVLAVPPDEWGIGMNHRIALAHFLARRRDDLISRYTPSALSA